MSFPQDPPGLCNGTRLVVKKMHKNVVEAVIITGQDTGKVVHIPRIPFVPSDSDVPFKRKQFPLKLSFAMSINKAQVRYF